VYSHSRKDELLKSASFLTPSRADARDGNK
jgi:hypothetical protein